MAAEDVKSRIASVKNIQKITRAMEMVAAARLRRAEQRIEHAAALRGGDPPHDPPGGRGGGEHARACRSSRSTSTSDKVGLLLVTGDRGLAGAFNSQIMRAGHARRARARARGREVASSTPPGAAASRRSRSAGTTPPAAYVGFTDRPAYANAREIADGPDGRLRRRRGRSRRDLLQRLHLAAHAGGHAARRCCRCSRRRSSRRTRTRTRRTSRGHARALVEYEPDPEEILQRLVPDYVEISIFRALLESTASEHGARMTAMRNASENAGELIETYPGDEPRPPGGDHPGDHGSRRRRRGARL